MKKSRFNESQIVGILKEADAGVKVQDIWRKYNISSATYYKWMDFPRYCRHLLTSTRSSLKLIGADLPQ